MRDRLLGGRQRGLPAPQPAQANTEIVQASGEVGQERVGPRLRQGTAVGDRLLGGRQRGLPAPQRAQAIAEVVQAHGHVGQERVGPCLRQRAVVRDRLLGGRQRGLPAPQRTQANAEAVQAAGEVGQERVGLCLRQRAVVHDRLLGGRQRGLPAPQLTQANAEVVQAVGEVRQERVGPGLRQRAADRDRLLDGRQRGLPAPQRTQVAAEVVQAHGQVGQERVGLLLRQRAADRDRLLGGRQRGLPAPQRTQANAEVVQASRLLGCVVGGIAQRFPDGHRTGYQSEGKRCGPDIGCDGSTAIDVAREGGRQPRREARIVPPHDELRVVGRASQPGQADRDVVLHGGPHPLGSVGRFEPVAQDRARQDRREHVRGGSVDHTLDEHARLSQPHAQRRRTVGVQPQRQLWLRSPFGDAVPRDIPGQGRERHEARQGVRIAEPVMACRLSESRQLPVHDLAYDVTAGVPDHIVVRVQHRMQCGRQHEQGAGVLRGEGHPLREGFLRESQGRVDAEGLGCLALRASEDAVRRGRGEWPQTNGCRTDQRGCPSVVDALLPCLDSRPAEEQDAQRRPPVFARGQIPQDVQRFGAVILGVIGDQQGAVPPDGVVARCAEVGEPRGPAPLLQPFGELRSESTLAASAGTREELHRHGRVFGDPCPQLRQFVLAPGEVGDARVPREQREETGIPLERLPPQRQLRDGSGRRTRVDAHQVDSRRRTDLDAAEGDRVQIRHDRKHGALLAWGRGVTAILHASAKLAYRRAGGEGGTKSLRSTPAQRPLALPSRTREIRGGGIPPNHEAL